MTFFQALVLGALQGITEFLPVSSTGHLILLPSLLGWPEQPLVFDTTIHLGTALALVTYFWRDIVAIAKKVFNSTRWPGSLGIKILAGSIPAGILGVLFGDYIEAVFRHPVYVALFLAVGSILMFAAELFSKKSDGIETTDTKKSFGIGLFQALALLPGISRSGASMSGGMLFGLTRESAARFSFLLSIPIVTAAAVFKLGDSVSALSTLGPIVLLAGVASSFVSGMLAVDFLLKFIKKHTFQLFIMYRLILAVVILLSFVKL